MGTLAEDYPEYNRINPVVTCFKLGEEPPAWVQWKDTTPQQRLRAVEYMRRSYYGYDPATATLAPTVAHLPRAGR